MDYLKKWEIVGGLGQGGQGKVHLVSRKAPPERDSELRSSLHRMTTGYPNPDAYQLFRRCLRETMKIDDPANQGALKVLHQPQDARDAALAKERIKREIQVMSTTRHTNLVEVLDVDPDSQWYVSKYYPNGTLAQKGDMFKGNLHAALKALRPLVDAVAELHKNRHVHRDIKPHNVFLGPNDELILGDFGLVHFVDTQHTRMSSTYENVGSRDWMPGWAMGMRVEEVEPTFDVFSLGKLLWSMLSGQPILQLWYFRKARFNVEELFPNCNYMGLANGLFARCIVEEEKDCLPDAAALLGEIDTVLRVVEIGADPIGNNVKRRCKVCGVGDYALIVEGYADDLREFGIRPVGDRMMKAFACSHCGHVQLFSYASELPPAWRQKQ